MTDQLKTHETIYKEVNDFRFTIFLRYSLNLQNGLVNQHHGFQNSHRYNTLSAVAVNYYYIKSPNVIAARQLTVLLIHKTKALLFQYLSFK